MLLPLKCGEAASVLLPSRPCKGLRGRRKSLNLSSRACNWLFMGCFARGVVGLGRVVMLQLGDAQALFPAWYLRDGTELLGRGQKRCRSRGNDARCWRGLNQGCGAEQERPSSGAESFAAQRWGAGVPCGGCWYLVRRWSSAPQCDG